MPKSIRLQLAIAVGIMLLVAAAAPTVPVHAQGPDGPTGTSQQALVNGQPVPAIFAEQYGLVSLTMQIPGSSTSVNVCSASLLTNDWVITAAHCITPYNIGTPSTVTITANWNTVQTRQAVKIFRFGNPPNWDPWDIALIRMDYRLAVHGDTSSFKQIVWGDGPFTNLNGSGLEFFGNGTNVFANRVGLTDVPSSNDGLLRYGVAGITSVDDHRYWYATPSGAMVAGGDSGGPSFVTLRVGRALTGVHSLCHTTCLSGHDCSSGWTWVTSTPDCGDAPVQPLWTQIDQIIHATRSPEPPAGPEGPAQFIGTFGATPVNSHTAFVYAVSNDGALFWYRQESNSSTWSGPVKVGNGWQQFKEVIPAGGNAFYALGNDGSLKWYRHDGFNDGTVAWTGPSTVGNGWNFTKIFAGGDGVVYAVRADGHLLWYQHGGYLDGGGVNTWRGPKDIGNGWDQFKQIFSMGQGIIYAVRQDGTLVWYRHDGYKDGAATWAGPKTVGNGWQNFNAIVPLGDGVIMAAKADGKMLWYKHSNYSNGTSLVPGTMTERADWKGPIEIGRGWQQFREIFGILPNTPLGPR